MAASKWLTMSMCLLAAAAGVSRSAEPPIPAEDAEAMRRALIAVSETWSRARVTYDHAAFERLLAPDYYVALTDQRVGRADFIAHISAPGSPGRLLRFDSRVMTITHQLDRNEWVAVVIGKMEWEQSKAAAQPARVYGLWTTREGYRRVDSTRWQLTFTEEIGSEYWSDGAQPPFADW